MASFYITAAIRSPNLTWDINTSQRLKNYHSFAQADEIMPKINAFKQYYVRKQKIVYLAQ